MLRSPSSLARLYQSVQYQHNFPTQICLNSIAAPYETEITCQDGSVKIIAWSNYAEKFPIPGWKHWLIGEDITITKKVHQLSPDTTHSILYTALNQIDVAICITDESAKFVYMNHAFGKLYGTRSEDLMNRQFTLMVPRDNRNLSIREYFNFLNGNKGHCLSKTHQALHADGYVFKVTTNVYRAVQNSEQAYVVWIFA
jgi:PAS domain S-box-containing protein